MRLQQDVKFIVQMKIFKYLCRENSDNANIAVHSSYFILHSVYIVIVIDFIQLLRLLSYSLIFNRATFAFSLRCKDRRSAISIEAFIVYVNPR